MAPSAVGAELSVMDVVAGVTITAATTQSHLDIERLPMTGVAADRAVGAIEHEAGLRVVIERPLRPVDRRVTHCAVIRKAITVRVVF